MWRDGGGGGGTGRVTAATFVTCYSPSVYFHINSNRQHGNWLWTRTTWNYIKSVISDLNIVDNHVSKLIMLISILRLSKGVSSTAARWNCQHSEESSSKGDLKLNSAEQPSPRQVLVAASGMGIQGLLPFLKKIHTPVNVSQFHGCTVAIDAYCWLHKGAFSCADKLALGEKTEQWVLCSVNSGNVWMYL